MLKIDNKGVSPVVGTILLIAITVALAAVVATLVSGLGGRGAPPNALLSVKAVRTSGTTYSIVVSHEGGDDLSVKDLQVQASKDSENLQTVAFNLNGVTSGTFSVGMLTTMTGFTYSTDPTNQVLTIYIIHKPSKEKIFSSSTVAVQLS